MSDIELAWAAGFFDGEGTIYATLRDRGEGRSELILSLSISQKLKSPVTRFHQAIGGLGKVYDYRLHPRPREKYTLRSRGEVAEKIFRLLEPYLCDIEGDEGREAIAYYRWVKAERLAGRSPSPLTGRSTIHDRTGETDKDANE